MVKNHSKKNDARNLIANTGQNLTSAMDEVSGVAKPSYLSTLTYPTKTWSDGTTIKVTPATFISWVDEGIGMDTVRRAAYDAFYTEGFGNGSEIAKLHDEFGFGFEGKTPEQISKFVPTSAQLIEHYGTWHDACIAAGIKSFNGYIVSFTFAENKLPLFDQSVDGVQEYPSWVSVIADDIVKYDIGSFVNSNPGPTRYYYDHNLFSDDAKALLLGSDDVKPDGILAATELAYHYADMATALRRGLEPNFVVLTQWRKNADQFMGKDAIPTPDQLVVLESAREYLKL